MKQMQFSDLAAHVLFMIPSPVLHHSTSFDKQSLSQNILTAVRMHSACRLKPGGMYNGLSPSQHAAATDRCDMEEPDDVILWVYSHVVHIRCRLCLVQSVIIFSIRGSLQFKFVEQSTSLSQYIK